MPKKPPPFFTDRKLGLCAWLGTVALAYAWALGVDHNIIDGHKGVWLVTGILCFLVGVGLLVLGGILIFEPR